MKSPIRIAAGRMPDGAIRVQWLCSLCGAIGPWVADVNEADGDGRRHRAEHGKAAA